MMSFIYHIANLNTRRQTNAHIIARQTASEQMLCATPCSYLEPGTWPRGSVSSRAAGPLSDAGLDEVCSPSVCCSPQVCVRPPIAFLQKSAVVDRVECPPYLEFYF